MRQTLAEICLFCGRERIARAKIIIKSYYYTHVPVCETETAHIKSHKRETRMCVRAKVRV